ncbi:bifunctional hydroxymethylpyrimidine kinase/phosphomethylpyrimidine kinase [Alkaliphilus pronyensis]|uniref:Hydroxymethylpyrimidine/phosphomethylpyrimidine kinase n=1 Tax=Alkaliphilus pronyensis TaxID=1482732 RepID=A0A6I0F866_9FIRM|nr:bifunctional hydroxymethylpyrimidine kinase/phosphomethylpyrimidine kinase [Alkaliphilus pronyensis]KAB3531327.1 bifunctional hydroxymethylpyrimidine kinase/phosphomethylpyrimidine kinase [Alkaliphilus pronyensis]
MKKVLTIAGSDSCGGAGIQADLKTFSAHGVYGMSVITAVTAQNTKGVFAVQDISPLLIIQQLEAIFDDITVDAVKIGMVSQIETIEAIAKQLKKYSVNNIVVDPVMISKSGYHLLQSDAKNSLIMNLLPLATIVTPNLMEAEAITGIKINSLKEIKEASTIIHKMGPKYVLVKGGHLEGEATDLLYDGSSFMVLPSERIKTKNTHGTGCTLSSAIASNIAKGLGFTESVKEAKKYITTAIKHSFSIGKGVGPTHHFYELYKKSGLNL